MRTFKGQGIPNVDTSDPTNFPWYRSKNSIPPEANNGTAVKEEDFNDLHYAILAVLDAAGITPNENPETVVSSQFLDAIQLLQGSVNKIIIDAPDIDASKIGLACRYDKKVDHTDYNNWIGVCESEGKLTLIGNAILKVRNRSATPWTAPKGTNVFIGDADEFGAGFVLNTLNNDNTDLLEIKNVVGELTSEVIFADTTTYFDVEIILKNKPMVSAGGSGGYWTQNVTEKTLTPDQPGITINTISGQWDQAKIKDKQRLVLSNKAVIFYDSTGEEIDIFVNIAINASDDLVSIDGTNGTTIAIKRGFMQIRTYTASGVGSVCVLKGEWGFTANRELSSNGSIILGMKETGEPVDGEVWYNSALLSHEEGTTYEINSHNSKTNLQGGELHNYWHLDANQWEACRRLGFVNNVTGADVVWLNENFFAIGDILLGDWLGSQYGLEIGGNHALVDTLDKFIRTAFCYFINDAYLYRTFSTGLYYCFMDDFDGDTGQYTISRSTIQSNTPDEQLEIEKLLIVDRPRTAVISALNVGAKDPNVAINGDIFRNSTSGKMQVKENNEVYNIINSTVNFTFYYRFSTDLIPPPSSGRVELNNATQANSTKLYVNNVTEDGNNAGNYLDLYDVGSEVYLIDQEDSYKFLSFRITGKTDQGTYFEYDIEYAGGSGDTFINNQKLDIHFVSAGGGGGTGASPLFFDARKGGSQQTISPSYITKITFNTENEDDGNNYNPSNSTYTNGSVAAKGSYSVAVRVTTAAAGVVTIWIRKNGTDIAGQSVEVSTANTFNICVSKAQKLQPNDYLEVYMLQTTGFNATVNNTSATRFSGGKWNEI